MRLLTRRRGQSTAEYAVLFAMVIGAAIAMQQFVKTRLQGAINSVASEYSRNASNSTNSNIAFEPNRATGGTSSSDIAGAGSKKLSVNTTSGGATTINKQRD